MKIPLLLLGALFTSILPVAAQTVGVTISSSTENTVFREANRLAGVAFTTDNSATSFSLNSVSLRIGSSYLINDFFMRLHNYNGSNTPGTLLGTLSGPNLPTGLAQNTWTADSLSLAPNTTYFLTWGFTSGTGAYELVVSNVGSPSGAWSLAANFVASSDGGSNWNLNSGGYQPLIAVSASAIPEPSTTAVLVGLGAVSLAIWRRLRPVHAHTRKSAPSA